MSTQLAEAVSGSSDPVAIGIFFVAGVLASLTPCVYPMIPIVVAYMGGAESAAAASGSESGGRKRRVVIRSLAYVLGMAVVYTALGLTAVLLGKTFGAMTQTAWAYWLVAAVLILFGLNLFGLFELRVPDFIMKRVGTGPREGLLGAGVMGATSAVVAAPCAAPIVFPLVTIIGTQGRVVFGGLAMLSFSLGLGLLVLLLGVSSGLAASVPRPGQWMVTLKKVLGVVMVLISLFFAYQGYLRW
jgi:thiol:disulfide interchange protein DsbD